jgi:hypothetical protein
MVPINDERRRDAKITSFNHDPHSYRYWGTQRLCNKRVPVRQATAGVNARSIAMGWKTSKKQMPASVAVRWGQSLDHGLRRYWYLFPGVAVGCAAGLAVAAVSVLRSGRVGVWLWPGMDPLLLVGVSLVVTIRKRFQQLRDKTGASNAKHRLGLIALVNSARGTVGRADLHRVVDEITNRWRGLTASRCRSCY